MDPWSARVGPGLLIHRFRWNHVQINPRSPPRPGGAYLSRPYQLQEPPGDGSRRRIGEEGGGRRGRRLRRAGPDRRLTRALSKKAIAKATPIQREAIPLILARTGSGKTFAYLLPMLQKLFSESGSRKTAPSVLVLVPTPELCQQVYSEASSLLEFCRVQLKVMQLTASMPITDMRTALASPPDIVVSTPVCMSTCMSKCALQTSSINDSLSMFVLDEADLLLSYGYEDELKSLVPHVQRCCQCLLMSATSSWG